MKFVTGKKIKQCPHCSFWVERTLGCDHMKCRCGRDFCYKCGGIHGKCECTKRAQEEHLAMMERIRVRRERQRQKMLITREKNKRLKDLERRREGKAREKEREDRARRREIEKRGGVVTRSVVK